MSTKSSVAASASSRRARSRPTPPSGTRDHHFPVDVVGKSGEARPVRPHLPEEYGGAGEDGDFTSLCVAIEVGQVDQSMNITLEAAVGLGINPILVRLRG